MVAPRKDNKRLENSLAGLTDLSHQGFFFFTAFENIISPFSLGHQCGHHHVPHEMAPGFGMKAFRGPISWAQVKVRTLWLGWGSWPILPQLSGHGLSVMTEHAALHSSNFVHAWFLVRCPHHHTLGQRDVAEVKKQSKSSLECGPDPIRPRSQGAGKRRDQRENLWHWGWCPSRTPSTPLLRVRLKTPQNCLLLQRMGLAKQKTPTLKGSGEWRNQNLMTAGHRDEELTSCFRAPRPKLRLISSSDQVLS